MDEKIIAHFPKVTKEQWLEKVKSDLKGKALESLNWELNESLVISPFKDQSDIDLSAIPKPSKNNNLWHTIEPIRVSTDLKSDNELILDSLQKGASGLCLYFKSAPTLDELNILLDRVFINLIPMEIVLSRRADFPVTVNVFSSFVDGTAYDRDQVQCYFSILNSTDQTVSYPSAQLISQVNKTLVKSQMITINGSDFYQGHSGVIDELGSTLHKIYSILDHYQNENLALRQVIQNINVECLLDDSYYINIAKIKALRRCTDMVYRAYGVNSTEELNVKIRVAPSSTSSDINYNRIRVASIAMSAVIAGVNRLEIFDINGKNETESAEFQRRVARNVSHLMQLESYMDRVNDPAAGSYYIESLTEEIADRAWADFQNKWSKTQA